MLVTLLGDFVKIFGKVTLYILNEYKSQLKYVTNNYDLQIPSRTSWLFK